MIPRLLALLTLFPAWAAAADLHAEAAMTVGGEFSKKLTGIIYGRGRVDTSNGDWYDMSVAPFLVYEARPNLTITGGSYLTRIESDAGGKTSLVRPFVTIEPGVTRGRLSLWTRSRVERLFFGDGLDDFNRFRQRLLLEGDGGRWTPQAYFELYFTAEGHTRTRYGGGVERSINSRHSFEVSYFYEHEGFGGLGLRHMIRTILHIRSAGVNESD
jgi:hypothetical protein